MKKIILIDGNAIIHRAYHAIPPFMTMEGELVNAVYGFASMLLNIMTSEKPDSIAVSFDTKAKTFRHKEYVEYKATRKKAPDDLYTQIPLIKDLVRAFNMPIYEIDGFEADDVLGTLAKQIEKLDNYNTYIVTGDMDTLQLISDTTFVMTPVKGFQVYKIYGKDEVVEKYGLTNEQIIDMKGLQGDSSDNIKGVAGVGAKTARTLLQKYKNIDGVYENLNEITGKLHERLRDNKDEAYFSKMLATIVLDVPIELDIEKCKSAEYDHDKILALFNKLGFKSLITRLEKMSNFYSKGEEKPENIQATLF